MTDFMSPSEMLSAYIDGELDEQSTSLLFYTMANNVELQQEMQQLMAIRTATSASAVQVPAHLKQAILAKTIGKEQEAVAAGGMTPMTTAGLVISAAAIASLATAWFLISDSSDNTYNHHNMSSAHTVEAHSHQKPALSTSQQSVILNQEKMSEPTQTQYSQHYGSVASSASPTQLYSSVDAIKEEVRNSNVVTPLQTFDDNNTVAFIEENGMYEESVSPAILHSVPFAFQSHTFGVKSPLSAISAFASQEDMGDFSVSVRGMMSSSLQSSSLSLPTQPLYSDMGIGVFYTLDESSKLGIEAGYDRWTQVYDGKEGDTSVRFEQYYNAPWVGVAYRHSVAPVEWLSHASPYIQGGIGVTAVGPLARIALGLQYPLFQSISLSAGIEASGLAYQYQGMIFSSQRVAFISTVSVGL